MSARDRSNPDHMNPTAFDDPRRYRSVQHHEDAHENFMAIRNQTLWHEREAREAEAAQKRLDASGQPVTK